MFPVFLDNAEVLLYSPKGYYETLNYTTGDIAAHISYYAIAKYLNGKRYYLFGCNEKHEVETDYLSDSIEECKELVSDFKIMWQQNRITPL